MGIDAQRSGASELSDRAVEVRRGRIAYPLPSGCPDTLWYARREFWAGQLAEKVHSSAQHDEGDPGVDRPERGSASERSRATPVSPAFWAVQSSPNGRWQSPARPMRPPGCGGTWTAVPRLGRGRGQAGGTVWPSLRCRHRRHTSVWVFVAAARRCAPTSPAPPRLASGPPALATRPFVLSPRTARRDPW